MSLRRIVFWLLPLAVPVLVIQCRTRGTPTAGAQQAPAADAPRAVEGTVLRPRPGAGDTTDLVPVRGAWVTLHRVGRDSAGPLDSVRTDGAGRYRFQWRPFGAADAIYFTSVTWGGIAYFTAPLRDARTAADGSITVFDTTSASFPLTVRGRHLIVGAIDSTDHRTVIEVYELSNDSLHTLVVADGDAPAPTWSAAVPSAARDVRSGDGDIPPDAFAFQDGRVSVFTPFAPGLKQVVFSYQLPATSFPAAFTVDRDVVVFEVLLEDPRGAVFADGFTAVDPVTLEGRNFRRFLAQDVREATTLTIELPRPAVAGTNLFIAALLGLLGLAMVLMLMRAMGRRDRPSPEAVVTLRPPEVPTEERLAQEIAALDAAFARQIEPSEAVRQAYQQRRAELRDALADVLAGAGRGR